MDLPQGIQPVSSYQPYQQQLLSQQQQHHLSAYNASAVQDVPGPMSAAEPFQAQSMHAPVYAQQQHLAMPVASASRSEGDNHPRRHQQHELPKKRPRKKAATSGPARATAAAATTATTTTTTSSSEIDMPAIIDRVPSGKERRRTQMRIAQRAYRQRKQNELSSRQKQLSERDNIIARMKTAFESLNSKLVDSDALSLYPDLSQPMQDMAQAFQALSQMATASAADSTTADNGKAKQAESVPAEPDQQPPSSLDMTSQVAPSYAAAGMTHAFNFQDFSNPFLHEQPRDRMTQAMPFMQQQQYTGRFDSASAIPGTEITLPTPMYIRPPTSFTFQETTFARRLMRTCMEAAHRVLINGVIPKEARVFKLAYRLWSKDYLEEKFQIALLGGDLFDPTIPFVPLGGAGTHYLDGPAATTTATDQQPTIATTPYPNTCGPLTTHTAHIRHDGSDHSLNGIVSSLGLVNEEWFDATDIDRYLRDMGINLEAHSTSFRFSLPANPNVASRRMAGMNLAQQAAPDMQEYIPAVVDVDRFLDCLVSKAMCLGRAPGFRKRDVEEQFYNSIEV